MDISRFFIDRPRFAGVISIFVFLIGTLAILQLPVSEYPEVAPPQVVVRAQFPGANPRHGHEWKVWKDVKLPDGKIIIPGVIDSTSNFVEHPELVADRLVQYARVVGPENVIGGVDCGFGTFAGRLQVDSKIVWMKLASLAEGAQLASRELW